MQTASALNVDKQGVNVDLWTSPQNARLDHNPTSPTRTYPQHGGCAKSFLFLCFDSGVSNAEIRGIVGNTLPPSVAHSQAVGQPKPPSRLLSDMVHFRS